jgi:hypothetical protein
VITKGTFALQWSHHGGGGLHTVKAMIDSASQKWHQVSLALNTLNTDCTMQSGRHAANGCATAAVVSNTYYVVVATGQWPTDLQLSCKWLLVVIRIRPPAGRGFGHQQGEVLDADYSNRRAAHTAPSGDA